jgi:hypothetical protein
MGSQTVASRETEDVVTGNEKKKRKRHQKKGFT